jgi:RNA polymerase sigma-70 factor (family 1)
MKIPLLSSDESVVLIELAAGNEMAYNYFVKKYWQKVLFHALSFVKSYPVAEELTQDVFIQLWQKKEKLSEVKNFENYLFIVSRNLIISHIRKKLVETESLKNEKIQEMFFKPDEQFEYKELDKIIKEGISLLSEPRRTIFLLSRVEGRDSDFICNELGLAKRTIRWHLAEALVFLRIYLNKNYGISMIILFFTCISAFVSVFLR